MRHLLLAASLVAATPQPIALAEPVTAEEPAAAEDAGASLNTDSCPHSLIPPEPRTTSEAVPTSPTPLPATVSDDSCGVTAPAGFAVPEEVHASAWLVFDIDSGEIVAEKDPHGRYRPASVIKALLAQVAIERLDPDQVVEATEEDASHEGSAVGIGAGGTYTVDQLLHALLMASGNDAAHALAAQLGGDEAALKLVNERAQELGTTDTRVMHYAGLDRAGQTTSAYDLGLIYRAGYLDREFADIVNTDSVDFPGFDDLPGFEVWNDNKLFLNDPDGIGGKTGFTDDANHTFVGALDRDGRRLAAVILDATADLAPAWQQAQLLLNEAYAQPEGAAVGELVPLADSTSTESTDSPRPTSASNAADASDTARRLPVAGILASVGVVLALIIGAVVSLRKR